MPPGAGVDSEDESRSTMDPSSRPLPFLRSDDGVRSSSGSDLTRGSVDAGSDNGSRCLKPRPTRQRNSLDDPSPSSSLSALALGTSLFFLLSFFGLDLTSADVSFGRPLGAIGSSAERSRMSTIWTPAS